MLDQSQRTEERFTLARSGQFAATGLFVISLLAVLKLASDVMAPIVAAILVGSILAQIGDRLAGFGLPGALANAIVVICAVILGLLLIAGLVEPFAGLVARAPDMAHAVMDMAAPLVHRLGGIREALGQSPAGGAAASPALGDAMGWISTFLNRFAPAVEQTLIFFPCLGFFVAGRHAMRRQLVLAMPERSSRLSALRVITGVERALAHYLATTTLVYAGIGLLTGLMAAGFGLPNPFLWGAMTFAAGYVPYIGVSLIALALAAAGLLAFPQSFLALAPAALYLLVHIFGEMAIIPMLLGRRYEINPFLIFLSIVFWTWMWGPLGAILASPLLLTAQTLLEELAGEPERTLP